MQAQHIIAANPGQRFRTIDIGGHAGLAMARDDGGEDWILFASDGPDVSIQAPGPWDATDIRIAELRLRGAGVYLTAESR